MKTVYNVQIWGIVFILFSCNTSLFSQSELVYTSPQGEVNFTVSPDFELIKHPINSIQQKSNQNSISITNQLSLVEKKQFRQKSSLKTEPILIYSDGTLQASNGQITVKTNNIENVLNFISDNDNIVSIVNDKYLNKTYHMLFPKLNTYQLFEIVNAIQKLNGIEYAEPDFIRLMKPQAVSTNDPHFESQWSIKNEGYLNGTQDADMDVDLAWSHSTGEGIKVAIIDEGVDLNHPDLSTNLINGYDATNRSSAGHPSGDDAHGTACAGIVASVANNSTGTAGVAYNAKIMPIRIAYSFNYRGQSYWNTSNSWIADGINWAVDNGADILSNSWGGGSPSNLITDAIDNAVINGREGKGALVLFAAGNANSAVSYPATLSQVIAVGASSMCDERKSPNSCDGEYWWGSNYGTDLDILSPGVKIYATDISGRNGYSTGDYISNFNGTSSACPNAAGVAALVLATDTSLTQADVRTILETSTDKISNYTFSTVANRTNGTWNNEAGYGRINALNAVLTAQSFQSTFVITPTEPINTQTEVTSNSGKNRATSSFASVKASSTFSFPNPADKKIQFYIANKDEHTEIIILNTIGQIVYKSNSKNKYNHAIKTDQLQSGLYHYRISNNVGLTKGTFVISH